MCFYLHKGFFIFNRKNRSVKRTETTDSILIEENEQEEEPDLPSLVENMIPPGQEVVQAEPAAEVTCSSSRTCNFGTEVSGPE